MPDAAPSKSPRRRGRLERTAGLPLAFAILGLVFSLAKLLVFGPEPRPGQRLDHVLRVAGSGFSGFGALLSLPFGIACLATRRPRLAILSLAGLLIALLGVWVATSSTVG